MKDKNCELLFEYLRSILYDSEIQSLNLDALDAPYTKLGQGLQFLEYAVKEMKAYSEDLARGNLSGKCPRRDNFLCENLKNIHANLRHLTWQAKQVADGDYSQHVSYLGEFSEAFNRMTEQLSERESQLRREAEKEKERALVMEDYNNLLVELTRRSHERILVLECDTNRILYCNQRKDANIREKSNHSECTDCQKLICNKLQNRKKEQRDRIWELKDENGESYRIMTTSLEWLGRKAQAHIIKDVTEERQKLEKLKDRAYHDLLTDIGNRYYLKEKMEHLLLTGASFIFCYCDLDHLKYVNDRYGHGEGDKYLIRFVDTVNARIREDDIFTRIGGDEFCLVIPDCPLEVARRKISDIHRIFQKENPSSYNASFSCGIIEVNSMEEDLTLDEIIQKADVAMYQQKKSKRRE